MISIWNINYEDGKVLLETSWFVSMKKTWDITRRESLTCLSITNEEHFNSEQSPNWLQIFFPKNNPSIKTIEYFGCFCRTNCFGVSFLGKFHQIQYSSLRLFFWRIISHAQLWVVCVCVCVCGTAWILMRQFRRSIRALLTNYAYKKNESTKSWSNKQLTAKVTTINQSPIWDFTTSWSVLYMITLISNLQLVAVWSLPSCDLFHVTSKIFVNH